MKKILFAMAMAAAAAALSSCEGRDNEGPAYDVDVEAAILGIDYYGEYDSGVGNYCLYLSDKGFHGEDELFYPDAFYYIGDMYGAVSESAQEKLPSGTFSYSYSMYYETDEEAIRIEDSVLEFESGTLSVSWEGDDCVVELIALTSDGEIEACHLQGTAGSERLFGIIHIPHTAIAPIDSRRGNNVSSAG